MNSSTNNAVRYNVVASCMTNSGAHAKGVKAPFAVKPTTDEAAKAAFVSVPFEVPDSVLVPRLARSLSLTLVKWHADGRREVLAERNA